jgi:response regulator RpfG family c-di-GMP phosphodiesterase
MTPSPDAFESSRPTVLAVDDTPDNLTLLSGLLKDLYKVKVANSGEKALRIAESDTPPDLILLDIMMPEMDGYEVCQRLKGNDRTRDIPIIFLTAKTSVEDEQHGLALGAADFITKPINPPIVLARVRTQLEVKKARDVLKNQNQILDETVRLRTRDLVAAQGKLENLIETGLDLGRERDRLSLLRKILLGGRDLLHCEAGTLFLVTERKGLRFAMVTNDLELPTQEIALHDPETGEANDRFVSSYVALHNEPVLIDDVYSETRFDLSGTKRFSEESGFRTVSMLSVPMSPRAGEVIGVLQFINALDPQSGAIVPFQPALVRFVTAMAAQAAVALDNFQLVEAQKDLMDALIKLIAGAIDAKSPYTGGHCERVPELGIMLAEAASQINEGPLADFRFTTDDEWREFRIGAWLHDCGKVTTPEYVVDKATKLETIHNRIHEVRTRFEVLLRDARIRELESVAAGEDAEAARTAFETRKAQLLDDFAFVAECNLGGEYMAPERIERLQRIAEEIWQRHFDDRLGLGHEELKRYTDAPAPLPASEKLLADKAQHVIPRGDTRMLDPKWGFKVSIPENLYNSGEVYNLSVGRGTLTEEERFKINEHVIQSLMMLEQLPLPANLKRVPEYAGTHHETLIGTGYPRKLSEAELSVPMRIMAIADIFEALTASDRPYKKAKTLSESIKILSFFKKDKHIDPDLFDLFLTSGVYRRYAEKYLKPEQIDTVDIAQYLQAPGT